jgi:hypothetical protein
MALMIIGRRSRCLGRRQVLVMMRPRNEKFFALFSKVDSNVGSAAILMESVTAPRKRRPLLAERTHDTEHGGNDTSKPNGQCTTPGLTCLAGTTFSLCSCV